MSNDKGMGRRQFFSRFIPTLSDTIIEKTKVEPHMPVVPAKPGIVMNSSVVRQSIPIDPPEQTQETGETGGIKFPWVGM